MKISTQRYLLVLMSASFFMACSRPYATFQRADREYFTTAKAVETPVSTTTPEAPVSLDVPSTSVQPASTPGIQAVQQQLNDAVAKNDNKLVESRKVQKRLAKVQQLLTAAGQNQSAVASTKATNTRKITLVERLMTKKLDKQIHKKLAPKKATANTTILATGAVVVIIGLLLILLTAGTANTIGVIALLAGAIILLVGLL
ncbi:hypothetical protein BN8_01228 [Fibrisoma limi BUZ 3]|uniref:Lipoprotein n=1 Tax=Fibrisoma limi BUZ 3 TaxID=1185876 RepID=I2GEB8_9BACT|nr:hypothetical protein [Fibrisoma limi]CCH52243.1 hypothetical protein BN8_01228 [Fibrisoma limi BUZ 3]